MISANAHPNKTTARWSIATCQSEQKQRTEHHVTFCKPNAGQNIEQNNQQPESSKQNAEQNTDLETNERIFRETYFLWSEPEHFEALVRKPEHFYLNLNIEHRTAVRERPNTVHGQPW